MTFSFLITIEIFANIEDEEDIFSRSVSEYQKADHLLGWIDSRSKQSLNGAWHYIVDPMDIGLPESFFGGFPKNKVQKDGMELIEYNFEKAKQLQVPGAWNSQDEKLFFYRGSVWLYKKFTFSYKDDSLTHLYFGGSNFRTKVFLNGHSVGEFIGGYVPFNFEVSDYLEEGENFLIVQVNNSLNESTIPTQRTDWWPYGGLIDDVYLVSTPDKFINNVFFRLVDHETGRVEIKAQGSSDQRDSRLKVSIPELGFIKTFKFNQNNFISDGFNINPKLWTPEEPKLYNIIVSTQHDSISDSIGFRTIETEGKKILLNGKPIKLKGISMHSEPIGIPGPAYSLDHFKNLLKTAKSLNTNFVRAAHYPYSRQLAKVADSIGLMLWEEIPVYWNIDWNNPGTLDIAIEQITRLIQRDWNRGSVIVWSVANETPFSSLRMNFLGEVISKVRDLDSSRLTTAALLSGDRGEFQELMLALCLLGVNSPEVSDKEKIIFKSLLSQAGLDSKTKVQFKIEVNDPLGEIVDLISYNEYFGWYYSLIFADQLKVKESTLRKLMFDLIPTIEITSAFDKPIHISEFGAGAKFGLHNEGKIWSEEYQEQVYKAQLKMISKNPHIQGVTPWILKDFRAMLRPLAGIQDFYNRKGLIDEKGNKKLAFDVLKDFYAEEWDE
ncbi:MAG: glycoside hydrolase family 2 TIM barrel-domain containing protein [SAR86 cluster bacterium]|nr:glycoside hydrolase family 2 TIM barrel-domain containing protein [SAR86 cluster bacterium]